MIRFWSMVRGRMMRDRSGVIRCWGRGRICRSGVIRCWGGSIRCWGGMIRSWGRVGWKGMMN